MNGDHIDHFCSAIQLLNEGGSKITEPNAGITSDMTGRWTIGAFDTSKKNKKETPEMTEVVGPNETGGHELGLFLFNADNTQINKHYAYMKRFEETGDDRFLKLAMNVVEKFFKIEFTGPLKTGLPIDET